MIASQRRAKILDIVNEKEIVNTKDLAELLGVTEMTIRRDCAQLEEQGKLIRVHGGIKKIKQQAILTTRDEKHMKDRKENLEQKDAICKKAASYVKDGDCIFLDGGTSIAPIVKYLKVKQLKIVTHSILIANEFYDTNSELIIIGGNYIPEYSMSVGTTAIQQLERFNFEVAFIGCIGFDLESQIVYSADVDSMLVKEKAIQNATRNYLLVDSAKLGVKGFYSLQDRNAFDAIFCDYTEEIEDVILPENFIIVK